MILGLLERLERQPFASFTEQDLVQESAEDFATLRSLGLLRRREVVAGIFCIRDGVSYAVSRDGDRYLGIEADENEPEIVEIEEAEIRRWTVELPALMRHLHEVNGLEGKPQRITNRLWFLGEDSSRFLLLGLYGSESQFESEALSLSKRFPSVMKSFAVACPSFSITPSLQRRLEDHGVTIIRFVEDAPFRLQIDRDKAGALDENAAFVCSEGYRSISLRGIPFTLSVRQAAVVAILHRAQRVGLPGLPWEQIQSQLKPLEYFPERIQDVFKGVKMWRELVKMVRPGFYCLNL